jgi:hypothetical protein
MLGFDAPLTIETKDVLGCPKGGRATNRNVSAIAIASVLRVERDRPFLTSYLSLFTFALFTWRSLWWHLGLIGQSQLGGIQAKHG